MDLFGIVSILESEEFMRISAFFNTFSADCYNILPNKDRELFGWIMTHRRGWDEAPPVSDKYPNFGKNGWGVAKQRIEYKDVSKDEQDANWNYNMKHAPNLFEMPVFETADVEISLASRALRLSWYFKSDMESEFYLSVWNPAYRDHYWQDFFKFLATTDRYKKYLSGISLDLFITRLGKDEADQCKWQLLSQK
jgi:hypothetical protein